MSTEVRAFIERFPARSLKSGDVIISNDPWLGASQLNDYTVVTPIFARRRHVGFVACCAHSPDVGGRVLSSDSADIHEEGFIIPPMLLYRAGKPNQDLFRFLRANVRVPDIVIGDLAAQVTSNEVVARRVAGLLEEARLPDLDGAATEIIQRGEVAMREAIAALPEGTYCGAAEADGDHEPIRIKLALTIADGSIKADFEGTSPQTKIGVNVTANWTYANVVHALLCALRPQCPVNAGSLRPISVEAPAGCILNARYPAAVGARILAAHHTYSAVFRALWAVLPDRVLAESAAPTWVPVVSGTNQYGDPFVEIVIVHGGTGAQAGADGRVVAFPDHPPSTHVEIFENEKPIVIERKEFLIDTAGAGRRRGGPGLHFRFRVAGRKPVRLSMRADRLVFPPLGFDGGAAGSRGTAMLNDETPIHPKRTIFLAPGDTVDFKTPGGGGFGEPRQRERTALERDVEDGIISHEAARKLYRRR
jgi:N-methylhydantoinase B